MWPPNETELNTGEVSVESHSPGTVTFQKLIRRINVFWIQTEIKPANN